MTQLDIKKELAKLTKSELIDLLCGLPIAHETASIVHQALADHAYRVYLELDNKQKGQPLTTGSLKSLVRVNAAHTHVCNLNTQEIRRQLIAHFMEATKQRELQRQTDLARISRDFAEYESRVTA